jgi:hypothetical protein
VYDNFEPLIALAAAPAVTERIRFATTILIAPFRASAARTTTSRGSRDRRSRLGGDLGRPAIVRLSATFALRGHGFLLSR